MIQRDFQGLVFEFAKKVSQINNIKSIILFGSVARGEADRRSDVDFLIVFDSPKPLSQIAERREVSNIALDLEKKFDRNIQIVFSNKNFDKLDKQFIESTLKEGIILYGKTPQVDVNKLRLEPFSLISFSLANLSKSKKMQLRRLLYGHETEKEYKGKLYKSKQIGLVEKLGGRRVGIASVLVPVKKAKQVSDLLKKFRAQVEQLDVWISKV